MDRVLVLNSDYTPLNVTTLIKGFNMVIKGKAEILKYGNTPIITGTNKYMRQVIIRLTKYINFRVRVLKVNRQRIFKRDDFMCMYCGSGKNLTIDHIIPKSRGGNNTWKNLITCCRSCNLRKDNRTPEESGMKLIKKPIEPTIFSNEINPDIYEIWKEFKEFN